MALDKEEILAETLDLVNKTRAAFKLKPLKEMPLGRRSSCTLCPLAKALSDCGINFVYFTRANINIDATPIIQKVWNTKIYLSYDIAIPKIFQVFIQLFDCKEYPELAN